MFSLSIWYVAYICYQFTKLRKALVVRFVVDSRWTYYPTLCFPDMSGLVSDGGDGDDDGSGSERIEDDGTGKS
jgi:hypothetical protein